MDSEAERALKRALAERPEVEFAYLFGSVGRGSAGPRSDVDVAVWLRETPHPDARLGLMGVVTGALKRDDVDVVVLNDAPLTLAFEALKGRLLVSRDEGLRVEVEASIMSRYHDRVHYMRRHLRAAGERIAERGYS